MKFLILLLISSTVCAQNFMSPTVIRAKGVEGFSLKSDCEKVHRNEQCVDIGNNTEAVKRGFVTLEDITENGNPTYGEPTKVVSCVTTSACNDLKQDHCGEEDGGFNVRPKQGGGFEAYCAKITGYEQIKKGHTLILDEAAIATMQTQKTQESQLNAGIAQAQRAMDCGRRVIAVLIVRNAPKNLSAEQITTMVNTYSETRALLETGSLTTARSSIMAIEPDGTIVTEGDKTALVSELDKCKPQ